MVSPPCARTPSTLLYIVLAPVSDTLTLTLVSFGLLVDHSIRPKFAPAVRSVLETIFLITFLAASIENNSFLLLEKYIESFAKTYNKLLKNTSLVLPKENKKNFHSYYVYVVQHPMRKYIMEKLKKGLLKELVLLTC